ncbi:lipopolysaccharide biosynthesis protein [Litoreibacter janthinus]|uniref:Membrane protein involved in the export of O-antigen and teichoic acid n=1 Tax=Litoreibacter janthinus TaxID=670154 RepID=A0A1I6FV53_9RHOB|nr:oligosaccharide flippase family protein [Litoreibacter janthinus]SFR33804.1 Membrane protein involved in the export of O-antigen and teichoic acid [Litoreibacter janthinus]
MPQSEARGVARHSAIYFLGGLANRSASFLLLPLYLKTLTPTEFGWLSLVLAATEILALGIGLGIGGALVRLIVACEDDDEVGTVIGSAIALFLIPASITLALIWPASQILASYFADTGIAASLFALGMSAAVFSVLFEVLLSVYRGLKKSWWYTFLSTAKSLLFLGLNLLFLLALGWGVSGILLGTFLSMAILCALAILQMVSHYPVSVSQSHMKRLARIGVPIVPGAVMDAVFASLDKFFLAAQVDAAMVGIYALAGRLAQLLRISVAAPFAQIWTVRRLEVETDPDATTPPPVFRSIMVVFLAVLILVSLALCLLAPEIIWVIGRAEYVDAALFLPLILLGLLLYVLKWNFEIGIYAREKTIWISLVSFATVATAIPVYMVLVPAYGAMGAAVAFVLLGTLRAGLTMIVANRISSIVRTFPFTELGVFLVIAASAYFASAYLAGPPVPFEALLLRIGILFCAALLGGAMLFADPHLRLSTIKNFRKRPRK